MPINSTSRRMIVNAALRTFTSADEDAFRDCKSEEISAAIKDRTAAGHSC